jgi:periplasmic divalent cation tolerance protein
MEPLIVVTITAPDAEQGQQIARMLVEERLAACVNIVSGVRSIYRWRGELCEDSEVLLWIKTRRGLFQRLQERVAAVHPYEVPEIIALQISDGYPLYLSWVSEETSDLPR